MRLFFNILKFRLMLTQCFFISLLWDWCRFPATIQLYIKSNTFLFIFILFYFQVIKKAVSKNLYNWCNIVWTFSSIWPVYDVVGVIIKHNSLKLFFRSIMVVLCIRGLIFLWFFLCTSISMFHIFELIFWL